MSQSSKRPELHLFVDNSNVLIEGRRYSEMKRKGRSTLGPYTDETYELDWGKFIHLVKSRDSRVLGEVPVLYGSRPPAIDSVWQRIRDDGFDVKLFDRNIRNLEKGVDMEMGLDIADRIRDSSEPGIIVIASGDADFVPVVSRVLRRGWDVEVWFWSNAAAELRTAAPRFYPMDAHLDYLRLGSKVPLP
jgi:uncharacterized LabA/DUF88 family protein